MNNSKEQNQGTSASEWPDEEHIDTVGHSGSAMESHQETDYSASALAGRLHYYNQWRRGADRDQPAPRQIGLDIEAAILFIEAGRQRAEQNAQMNETLNTCALKFREYARIHSAKPDHAKAMANMEMAWLAESAMSESCKVDSASGSSILREERARAVEDFVDSVQRDSLRPHKKTLIALGKHYANQVRQGKK